MTTTVLLTGGAGYIGSHTAVRLLEGGWDVVVVDDFSNSSPAALERVAEIAPGGRLRSFEADIRDTGRLTEVLRSERVEAVVHFAGLKAVGESTADPLRYYSANVAGSVSLLQAMDAADVRRLVFSSSCTVYGEADVLPVTERTPRQPASSPYGRNKQMVEDLVSDVAASDPRWRAISLRYFNPVGAHPSGRIGEDPSGTPNNLMPLVMQVAVGRRPFVAVYGGDYPTPDGTGVATTSTWSTSRPPTRRPSSACRARARRVTWWSTSVPGRATASSRSSTRPPAPAGGPSPTRSSTGGRETWPPRGPT